LAVHSISSAAPPVIRNIDRLGLQIGASTTLTIDGDNLLPEPRLILSVPIVKQVVQPKGTTNRVVIEVTLDKAAVPGLYNLRLVNSNGVSAGRVVAVDHLPQHAWEPKIVALPVSLHGTLAGSGKMTTSFAGKAGQAILCEVEAQRLGGKCKPVLHLYDESGRQLAWSLPSTLLGGDARLSATLPADGVYSVEVHDAQYAAAAPGNFRLKIGSWQYVDAVFPPAVRRGQSASVELLGNTPGQRVSAQTAGEVLAMPLPWTNPLVASGPKPRVLVSDLPEIVEKEGTPLQESVAAPAALNGRLARPGEVDRFRLSVEPGTKLRLEVFAEQLGSPLDTVLKLERDNGTLLAQADDAPGSTDPKLDYTVPADVKSLVVALEDLHGRGGPDCIYRVVVRPTGSRARDFRLFLPSAELNVPISGSRVVEVDVERDGYTGPIRLAFEGLPGSGSVLGTDVPTGANGALVTLMGGGPAPATTLVKLRGTSVDAKEKLTRTAQERTHPLRKLQPWLAEELAVALTPPEKPTFAVQWGTLPADAQLVAGSSFKVPLGFTPPKEEHGGVRLYLVSSHRPPRVNGQPNVNESLRKDQGPFLDLPAGKTQGEFVVLVPATLPNVPQDLAFRAELLSKDRGRVIAQGFTPVRRFTVLNPLFVQLAATQLQALLDAKTGAEIKLTGKIERRGGFKGDVTVSLAGVPAGIAIPSVVVKADKSDFVLPLRFPATLKPLDLAPIEVFATGRFAPNSPLLNRSEAVAVRIKLAPAAAAVKK
jgi:hypothetical protein